MKYAIINVTSVEKPPAFLPMRLLKRLVANRLTVCTYVIINANNETKSCGFEFYAFIETVCSNPRRIAK